MTLVLALLLVAIISAAGSWWLVRRSTHHLLTHPAAQVIRQFYAALQQHEYQHALAWMTFDSPRMTGAPTYTPATFLAYVQHREQTYGPITEYAFTARMKTEGPTANYWLRVKRQDTTYLVPLALARNTHGWQLLPHFTAL